jgi:hypothetical protein
LTFQRLFGKIYIVVFQRLHVPIAQLDRAHAV